MSSTILDTFEVAALSRLREAAAEGRLILFCGAGVSMVPPTGAPSWWEIYSVLTGALKETLKSSHPKLYSKIDVDELTKDLNTQEIANLVIQGFGGATFGDLLRLVDAGEPNSGHMSIAQLLASSAVDAVITTNFDTMIERAARQLEVNLQIATPANTKPLDEPGPRLIKLHGTAVEPLGMLESSWSKFTPVDPTLKNYFARRLRKATVFVAGYSGSDIECSTTGNFFSQAVEAESDFVWLCRSDRPPVLPKHVMARTTFVRGSLPDAFHDLQGGGAPPKYPTRQHGRSARDMLNDAAIKWCARDMVGPMAACVLFLSLAERQPTSISAGDLRDALLADAELLAGQFEVGSAIPLNGTTTANFLRFAGLSALQHARPEPARAMLRASLNILVAFRDAIAGTKENPRELDGFMSAGYVNFAIASIVLGEKDEAHEALRRAILLAYRHSDLSNLLSATINLYNYILYPSCTLRDLQYLDRLTSLAVENNVPVMLYELELVRGSLLVDRNEIWAALTSFQLARSLGVTAFDPAKIKNADLRIAECDIRQGRVEEGLNFLATNFSGVALAAPTMQAVGSYLSSLRVEGSSQFLTGITLDKVQTESFRITTELRTAKREDRRPFGGAPVGVERQLVGKAGYVGHLCEIGALDINAEFEAAVVLASDLADHLLRDGYHYEAQLVLRNILARDALTVERRIRAAASLATASSQLGDLEEAERWFRSSHEHLVSMASDDAMNCVLDGMWFFAQIGEVEEAKSWAHAAVSMSKRDPNYASDVAWELGALRRLGGAFSEIGNVLADVASAVDPSVKESSRVRRTLYDRRFSIWMHESTRTSGQQHAAALGAIEKLISAGDYDQAKQKLSSFNDVPDLSEEHTYVALCLHGRIASRQEKGDVERYFDTLRDQALRSLAFTGLAFVEWEYLRHLIGGSRYERIVEFAKAPPIAETLTTNAHIRELLWTVRNAVASGFQREGQVKQTVAVTRMASQGGYFGTASFIVEPLRAMTDTTSPQFNIMREVGEFREAIGILKTSEARNHQLRTTVRRYRKAGLLDWTLFAALVETAAHKDLLAGGEVSAIDGYVRATRLFSMAGNRESAFRTSLGRARATSLVGDHAAAIAQLWVAQDGAYDPPTKAEAHSARGAAYVRLGFASNNAMERSTAFETAYLEFESAVILRTDDVLGRARSRLGMAAMLWYLDRREESLETVDMALSELAHLASPIAKLILERRADLEAGDWSVILN